MRLNVGCSNTSLPGYLNIDIVRLPNVELVADIISLPFKDGSIDGINCSHVLEHLYYDDAWRAIKEFSRVLTVGSKVKVTVPSMSYISNMWHGLPVIAKCAIAPAILGSGPRAGLNQSHVSLWDEEVLALFLGNKESGNLFIESIFYDTSDPKGVFPNQNHWLTMVGVKQ